MTIETEASRISYFGNNQESFDFNFIIPSSDDILVQLINESTGDVENLVYGEDYSVDGLGWPGTKEDGTEEDPGGTVILTDGPISSSYRIIIQRKDMSFLQEYDLKNQGAYFLETLEKALDMQVMYLQQLGTSVNQTFVVESEPKTADYTADFTTCRHRNIKLGASIAITLVFPGPGVYTLKISQDEAGGHVFALTNPIRWLGGMEPGWYTDAETYCIIAFRYDGYVIDAMGDIFFGPPEDEPTCP